jgi:hypothetical protein
MIIDAHVHLGSWVVGGKNYGYDKSQLKEIMKSLNIDRMCILPIGIYELFKIPKIEERNPENNIILENCKNDKSLIPIFWLNPFREKEYKKSLEEGFKGLKYHPHVHLLPISDNRLKPVIEIAREFEAPVFVHTSEKSDITSIFRVQEVAEKYPDVNFFALHSINSISVACLEAKKLGLYDLDNIFYCTGGSTMFSVFRFLYETIGPEHIIFSSDIPFGHPGVFMKYIELLTDDEKERKLMLGENIQKILKL